MPMFSQLDARRERRRAPETEPRYLLPRHDFEATLARNLRLLRGIHIPMTLFAVRLPARGLIDAEEAVGDALSLLGMVGRLACGRIGLLYLGPHALGAAGDEALTAHVLGKVERRLHDLGWGSLCRNIQFWAIHAWTDAIADASELLRALDDRKTRRTAPGRAAGARARAVGERFPHA